MRQDLPAFSPKTFIGLMTCRMSLVGAKSPAKMRHPTVPWTWSRAEGAREHGQGYGVRVMSNDFCFGAPSFPNDQGSRLAACAVFSRLLRIPLMSIC